MPGLRPAIVPLLLALDPCQGQETATVRLAVREAGTDAGQSLPCRVHLWDAAGEFVRVPGLPFFRDHFNCETAVDVAVPAGRCEYTIARGPEYREHHGEVELSPGEHRGIDVELERWIDLAARGWWSGETHVHRPLEHVGLLMRSEDLHVAPVLTQWNRQSRWDEHPLPERLKVEVGRNRVMHVLACEDERQGGALLYLNLSAPLELGEPGKEHPSPMEFLRQARRQDGAWVEVEKPFWWDVPAWVASGEVDAIGLANNHMCRSTMYESEAWGRPRDGARLPKPRGNGLYSQEIYYRLLNCGFRVPPTAGSASGVLSNPVGYNRVYVHLDGDFSYEAWFAGLASGRSFVTNGPVLLVEANGRLPGEVFRAPDGVTQVLSIDIRVDGNEPLEAVEVIQDGAVVWRRAEGELRGWHRPVLRFTQSGWFLVRAIARVPHTFRFASTAPFYVEIGGRESTVHPEDVQYFLDWIDQRVDQLQRGAHQVLEGERLESVLAPHRRARQVFEGLLER